MWMLAPAAASVVALVALTAGLRLVARASAQLRAAARKSSSAAVAGDELARLATHLGDHAETTRAAVEQLRAGRRRGARR